MQTTDQTTKTTPAGPAPTDRIWIGVRGETRCDTHAGGYLSAEIAARPNARYQHTGLDDWVAVTRAEADCETCERQS